MINKSLHKSYKWIFCQIVFNSLGVLTLALTPILEKNLFDYGFNNGLSYILLLAFYFLLLNVIYTISQYLCMLCAFKSGISFEKALKQSVITKIFQLNYTNFKQKTNSEYLSLMSNDITAIEQDYLQPLIDVIRSTIDLIIYTIILIIGINYKIAIIIISLSIIAIAAPKILGNRLENARSLYQKNLGKYTTLLSDLLSGFKLIDQHTLSNFLNHHEQGLENNAQLRYAYGKEKSNVLTISLFFTKLVKVIVFGITCYLFYKQEITIGSGVATFSYVYSFIEPIDNLLYDVTSIKSIKKSLEILIN